jgi:hypothetical protein
VGRVVSTAAPTGAALPFWLVTSQVPVTSLLPECTTPSRLSGHVATSNGSFCVSVPVGTTDLSINPAPTQCTVNDFTVTTPAATVCTKHSGCAGLMDADLSCGGGG